MDISKIPLTEIFSLEKNQCKLVAKRNHTFGEKKEKEWTINEIDNLKIKRIAEGKCEIIIEIIIHLITYIEITNYFFRQIDPTSKTLLQDLSYEIHLPTFILKGNYKIERDNTSYAIKLPIKIREIIKLKKEPQETTHSKFDVLGI